MGITITKTRPSGQIKASPPLGFKNDPSYPLEAENGPWHQVNFPGGDPHFANVVLLANFDQGSFGSLVDDSNSAHDLTNTVGSISLSTATVYSGSHSLHCTGGDLRIPASSDWSLTDTFTIEMWGYATGGTKFFSTRLGGNGYDFVWNANTGQIGFEGYSANSTGGQQVVGGVSGNTWHHVAWVSNGADQKVFVDGVLMLSRTFNLSWVTTNALAIGRSPQFNEPWTGFIDEVRVTKGVARYTEAFTPPTAPFPTS